jgi:hypothetical protein
MRSFIAQIIYSIACAGVTTEQYEEQYRLVLAADSEAALQRAKQIAANEECLFIDRHGRAVQWKLLSVKDIQEVTLSDGELLVSSVKEVTPVTDPLWIE